MDRLFLHKSIHAPQDPAGARCRERVRGESPAPAEKVQAAFAAASDRMLHVNSVGSHLHLAGDIAVWLTFAATSFITLIQPGTTKHRRS
jgi:hypothetical protein